jgi:polyhydroxyalkanoate synthesis regulator phasin
MAQERNFFQEGLHVGLGLALRTQEKIQDFAKQISSQYEMTEEEGKRFAEDLSKQTAETRTELDKMIQTRLNSYLEDMNIPKKDDIDKLTKKINELEKKLDKQ